VPQQQDLDLLRALPTREQHHQLETDARQGTYRNDTTKNNLQRT